MYVGGGGGRGREQRGEGGFASVMSAVGDYPMLTNAHVLSLPSLFELCAEQKNHGVLCESINHNFSFDENSISVSR